MSKRPIIPQPFPERKETPLYILLLPTLVALAVTVTIFAAVMAISID